jgi:hypothetical protein
VAVVLKSFQDLLDSGLSETQAIQTLRAAFLSYRAGMRAQFESSIDSLLNSV